MESLNNILTDYPLIAPLVFVIARMLPLVFPPIPGLFMDIVGIAVFGWFYGYILALVAIIATSMISFHLSRKFGKPFVQKFIPLDKIEDWEDKFSETEKFWGLISLRFISSPIFDSVNYIAGLTKITYTTYLWTTIITSVPLGFLIYYFGDVVLNSLSISIFFVVSTIPFIIWYRKKRGYSSDLG